MKKLILLFALVSCSVLQSDSLDYTVSWDANAEPDISHYNVYIWVGTDTLQCPLFQGMPIGVTHPTYLTQTSDISQVFSAESDGINYMRAGVQAVDTSDRQSTLAVSEFVLTEDVTAPEPPTNVRIN